MSRLVEDVNKRQGFRIVGWYKPGRSEQSEAIETFSFHICFLMPNEELSTRKMDLRNEAKSLYCANVI